MDDLGEMLEMIDVESYLDREGVQYRITHGSSGVQLNLKSCPFCGGNKWKVFANAETGRGNCFSGSCETKFNLYKFINAHLGVSKVEVIRHIKAVALEHGWRQKRKVFVEVKELGDLTLPESVELPFNGKNIKYLAERGITSELAEYFHLRYSKSGTFDYEGVNGAMSQDYSSRVIIPIYNLEGELVSFQGRDMTGTAAKKYLFPPGFASTGKYLYNGHNANLAQSVVLCEGAFDVFAAKKALDEDVTIRDIVAIGSFGKHLTNSGGGDQIGELIKLKNKMLKKICIAWDGEYLAAKAAIETALTLNSCGFKASVAFLPKGCDPNEVPTYVFRKACNESVTINKSTAMTALYQAKTLYR